MGASEKEATLKKKNARSGVVIPEDLQRGLVDALYCLVSDKLEQVTWSPTRVFADQTGWVCACRVEVP